MPLIRSIQINGETKVGIWHMEEPEDFFLRKIRLSWEVTNPHKRLQHMAVRYLLLVLQPDFPMNDIVLSPSQKPLLEDGSRHFSFSHSRDFAAAIIGSLPVGIDVEAVDGRVRKVATRFLGDKELQVVPQQGQLEYLTLCWCAKEALYKWAGLAGLSFRDDMDLSPFQPAAAGLIQASVHHKGCTVRLQLHYFLETSASRQGYALVWVQSSLPEAWGH